MNKKIWLFKALCAAAVWSVFAQTEIPAGKALAGTQWTLASMVTENGETQEITVAKPPTIDFTKDGSVFGFAGVNRFSGTWKTDGERLILSPLAMTRMLSFMNEINALEHTFSRHISAVYRYYNSGDSLTLFNEAGTALLIFTRTKM